MQCCSKVSPPTSLQINIRKCFESPSRTGPPFFRVCSTKQRHLTGAASARARERILSRRFLSLRGVYLNARICSNEESTSRPNVNPEGSCQTACLACQSLLHQRGSLGCWPTCSAALRSLKKKNTAGLPNRRRRPPPGPVRTTDLWPSLRRGAASTSRRGPRHRPARSS